MELFHQDLPSSPDPSNWNIICRSFRPCFLYLFDSVFLVLLSAGIYILAISPFFVQIIQTGQNLKDFKKGKEKGGKEEKKEKSDKTHVKIPLTFMKLK